MATAEQLRELRALAPDAEQDDEALGAVFDQYGTLDAALASLWDRRAAETANLVDISESGSSRKLSQVHATAVARAQLYAGRVAAATGGTTAGSTAVSRVMTR